MIVGNKNITSFQSLLASDILSTFTLLDADFIKNQTNKNYYTSSKMHMGDLSSQLSNTFVKLDTEVSGQWTFKYNAHVPYPKMDADLINLKYISDISSYLSSKIHALSVYIYDPNNPHIPTFPGQIISTYESDLNKVNQVYGGAWQPFGNGKFILGARSSDAAEQTGGNEHITLTTAQAHTPVHNHPASSFSVSASGKASATFVDGANSHRDGGHTNRQDDLHTSHPITNVPRISNNASTNKTISGNTSTTSNGSAAKVDMRPRYFSIYFYKRIS